jgi:hypothetical protein
VWRRSCIATHTHYDVIAEECRPADVLEGPDPCAESINAESIHEGPGGTTATRGSTRSPNTTPVGDIAASIALVNYWDGLAMRRRATSLIAGPAGPGLLADARSRAARLFIADKINREGLDRIANTITLLGDAQGDSPDRPGERRRVERISV